MEVEKLQSKLISSLLFHNKSSENPFRPPEQQPQDSKHSYTALIFNENSKKTLGKYTAVQTKQGSFHKDSSAFILDTIKIQSLSRVISNKNIGNSSTIFENTKLNNTLHQNKNKVQQRPASAQTKYDKKTYTLGDINKQSKQKTTRKNREMSLMGKRYFQQEVQQVSNIAAAGKLPKDKSKSNKTVEKYEYCSKSRLNQGKQNQNSCGLAEHKQCKKSIEYIQLINFESLHKNLLINSKSLTKTKLTNHHSTPYFYKKHRSSVTKQRNKENDKSVSEALIIDCEKKQEECSRIIHKLTPNSKMFNKFYGDKKIPRKSDTMNSFKKLRHQIKEVNKTTYQSQPQIYIQNITIIPKNERYSQKPSLTSTNMSNNEERMSLKEKQGVDYSLKAQYLFQPVSSVLNCKAKKYN